MPTAIVTGATGINGREIVRALASNPSQWTTVHAISRNQKESYPSTIKHNSIDLLAPASEIASQLSSAGVEGEYLFFTAYLQRDDEKEMDRVNGDMLQNFLEALRISGAEKKLKRVVLTTGAKHYGVHLGPVKVPMEEEDPWVEEGEGRPVNFYYRQQKILKDVAKGRGWDWVVTYPNDVIGVAKGNFMNLTTAIGLYAAVTKELNQPFLFPGNPDFYTRFDCFTYSRLHGQFNLWAALEPRASNQNFNVVNGDVQSWQTLWPRLAHRYGLSIPPDQFSHPLPQGYEEKTVPLSSNPPLNIQAPEMGIQGHVPNGELRMRIDLLSWSQKPEVKEAWNRLAEKNKLQKDAFEKATWFFTNFVLGRNYDVVISMNKARKLGWVGSVDTWDALSEALDELEKEGILPKRK
ncbi:hypothetical protein DTO212C5_6989 [Paecilomyces variotii]|nr:hypothetical protein DTO212C5_6989 [Paecilomyces variotii]